jgi:hypothetical protein
MGLDYTTGLSMMALSIPKTRERKQMTESQTTIRMALLLRQMIVLHGTGADEWKGTAEWCAMAASVEEEVEELLKNIKV